MVRKLWIGVAIAVGVSIGGSASALTETVNYGFVPDSPGSVAGYGSHFDSTTPTVTNNMAPITGSAQLTYEVNAPNTPPPTGSVTVQSLIFDMDFGAAGYGGAELGLAGTVHAVLVNPVTTTQTHGVLAPLPGTFHLSGTITCTAGQACQYLGVPASTTLNVDEPSTVGGSGPPDLSLFSTTVPLTTIFGALTTTGYAVLKPLPEPGTLLLLGAGIAGLVAAGRWRRS